jgi:GT2 family glycosyltransferase
MKLSVVLIGYNSRQFLSPCLESVKKQTFKDYEVIFIDNASKDDSVEFVKENYKKIRVIANKNNTGYVGAANQGIKSSSGEYVMVLNPDLVLEPDYFAKIVAKLDKDKKIGAIAGKVLKYDFKKNKPVKTIDTTGLYCYRNRRVIDRGQGLADTGQYDTEEEVFGLSGAVPTYRRAALEDTKIQGEYLDRDFFMYKEDIDLSWRLRLYGWKCYYYPTAVCYHGRGTGVLKRFSHWEVYKGRKHLNRFQKYYAYKNQRLMQVKNELLANLIRDAFSILSKEILIFGYIIVREPYLLKAFGHFWLQLPSALRKRRHIMRHKKSNAREMKKWISGRAKK